MKTVNFSHLYWYAQRASAVYEDEAYIREHFPQTTHVHTLDAIDVQYFIECNPDEKFQLLSVRGTANIKNVLEDADYLQSKDNVLSIYVHRGFDRCAFEVYQHIKAFLTTDLPMRLTGHSLGAAISTLLMMYLHKDGYDIEQSINFGQPKVTNRHGVDHYRFLPLTRVIDKNDIVPCVPPMTLLDSVHGIYQHLGDEIILLDQQDYQYLAEHDAERQSVGNFWRNLGDESFEDHHMDNYLLNIKNKFIKT